MIFNALVGDYYMRGNKEQFLVYTMFRHSIVYTTKSMQENINKGGKQDTPSAVYKIKDKFYYTIYSNLEY